MITYNKETPILLVACASNEIIINICKQLQRIQPQRLYMFFENHINEKDSVEHEQIQSIFNEIKWKCKVKVKYCKKNSDFNDTMLKAIRWFFRRETEGIVLNGKSIPFPSFFSFCSCLLEKYRYDERIGYISCADFLMTDKKLKNEDSYYFSKLIHVSTCWASWRRVWQGIDKELKTFSSFKKHNIIEKIPSHKPFRNLWHYWNHIGENWEARYEYSNLINNRLSIVPNMIQLRYNEYELQEMKHPVFMVNNVSEELRFQEIKYNIPAITPNKPDGMMFLQEKLLLFSAESRKKIIIPKIIHQIYEDPAGPPANLLNVAESWKENHPEWEYRFWDKKMINSFLETQCADFLQYYNSFPFNVQRWDAIRYLILYHIGGLYVDFDYECIKPLDALLTESTCCMGMEPTFNSKYYGKPLIVGNALMASTPKHPYMAAIIKDLKTNFHVDYKHNDAKQILESTGPFMVSRVYKQLKRKKDVTLLPADLVTPLSIKEVWMLRTGHAPVEVINKVQKAFAIHYFWGSWSPQTKESKVQQKM